VKRNVNPKLIAGAVAGLAVAGGGAALAASHFSSPQQESQAVVNDAAKQLGIQPSKLSDALKKALENRVDAAVADGRITSAQGAEMKRRIESGDFPIFGGPGPGRPFVHPGGPFSGLDAAASYLGLTQAQLLTKLESGTTLAAIAKSESKSVSGLVDAMYDAAKKDLDAAVSSGRLSQAQETQILSDLKAHLADLVNGARPDFRDRDHDHDGFGGPPPGLSGGPQT
jgi:hypothetical protein